MRQATTPPTGRVLLTVSGVADPLARRDADDGTRPARDYIVLADVMGADLLDVPEARRRARFVGRALERIGGAPALLAWVCFRQRRRYDAVFTDGEQVGLPLALLCRLTLRRPFAHVMIVHILSVRKKELLYRWFRLGRYIDTMVVYSTSQATYASRVLGFPAERVVLSSFMVDTEFFDPARVTPNGDEPMICTAGLELRDYPTLIEAVRGLPVRVVVAAASPWSKRDDSSRGTDLPPNVAVAKFDLLELRQLYADAAFVVMPLLENDFQAGITTILEAMAMGKAVVCSRTRGQRDVIVEGVNGCYVAPGDVAGLRQAIEALLADPQRATELGAAGRAYAESEADVRQYAARLAVVAQGAAARDRR